jgi:hypothetical protein
MGTGYTRNDTSNNISDGNVINSADLDGEFDAIVTAFSTSGHTHDGTAAEGGAITFVGPVQDLVVSATEVKPKTTNTLSIGTNVLQFKDLYIDGKAYIDGLGESILVDTDKKIEFRSASNFINSSTTGQLDIDAGSEVEITTTTLDINATTTDISSALTVGGAITASSGGSLTGTWSDLGTVTTIDINGGTIDGATINATPIGGSTAAAGSFTTLAASGALTSASLNVNSSTTITGVRNSSTLSGASASATHLATEQAIKAYVDAQVDTVDTLSEILAIGNTTGSNNIVVSSGQAITTNTINETTAASGVTVDSVLLKDGVVTGALTGNVTGNVTGNLTGDVAGNVTSTGTSTFTTVDINGGAIDGTSIGSSSTSSGAFTTLSASSTATFYSSTSHRDNVPAYFGNSNDLQILHNGTDSVIQEQGTGSLYIQSTGGDIILRTSSTDNAIYIDQDNAVTLYYDNAAKLATNTSGISVTGNITVSGTVDGRDVATDGAKLDTIATSANNYTHPTHPGDDINIDTGALSGVTVISDLNFNITTDTLGHVTDANGAVSTRSITLGDFGITATAGEINALDGIGTIWHNGNDALSYSSSNTSSGYVKLPNGLYIQWGFDSSTSGYHTVTFPIAFPSYCFSVVTSIAEQYAGEAWTVYHSNWNRSRTGFTTYSSSAISDTIYIAIGI